VNHTETHLHTGLPGLDRILGGGIGRHTSVLTASTDPRQATALTAQITRNIADAGTPTLALGITGGNAFLDPAPNLHISDEELGSREQVTETLAYAAGKHTLGLASFGLLEHIAVNWLIRPVRSDALEEAIEDIGLAALYVAGTRQFTIVATARLEDGWRTPAPLDALGMYDPLGGHFDLVLFIEPAYGASDESDVAIRIVKWRHGPTGLSVPATWDSHAGEFQCLADGGPR